jgi:tetratricopeptide (TPR) repeat protein
MTAREEKQSLEKHLSYARGWLELGKIDEAALELEEVPPGLKLDPSLLSFRCDLYKSAGQWDMLASISKHLVGVERLEPWHWLNWAYGTRRHESIQAAERILLRAQEEHPKSATIHFNLACYASQQGRFAETAELLGRAITLDARFKEMAADDPDLAPYWASLKTP